MSTVDKIIENHWNWQLPVDIYSISNQLNVQIMTLEQAGYQDIKISVIAEAKCNQRIVAYNKNEPEHVQRYSIAHGLGHHMLNHITKNNEKIIGTKDSFSLHNQDFQEKACNDFALNILLPSDAIKYMVFKEGITDLDHLSQSFQVSGLATYTKLERMGLLSF